MITLEQKVRFLHSPAAYGGDCDVRALETHMSWLFFAGGYAFKLKKPVRYAFLDFSTVDARRRDCEAEVRLNARLAGDTYIGVLPLRASGGTLSLGGEGEIVDWLVKMKRLPAEDMLDARIRGGNLSASEIDAVGERLATFYLAAVPEIERGRSYLAHLETEQAINRKIIGMAEFGLASRLPLVDAVTDAVARIAPVIELRIAAGRIVEGHGDLRPEHICLADPPLVIDCLEFDRRMRIVDPYDEVNYLGLECDLLGAPWVRPRLLRLLELRLNAYPGATHLGVLGAFRMVTRARISLAHLLDPEPSRPEHWPQTARLYLEIAERELVSASDRGDR